MVYPLFLRPDHAAGRPQGGALEDAATYITKLPEKKSALPTWQTAVETLMLCSRGGDSLLARIGFMKAADSQAARIEAARRIGKLLHDHAGNLWEDEDWQMDVTDEKGLILFVINIDAMQSSAVSLRNSTNP